MTQVTFALFALMSTLLLAAATPLSPARRETRECNTEGGAQCCQQQTFAGDPAAASLLAQLGVIVQDANTPVAINCSPIRIVGLGGGSSCDQTPVCCSHIHSSGIIAVNCVPITITV